MRKVMVIFWLSVILLSCVVAEEYPYEGIWVWSSDLTQPEPISQAKFIAVIQNVNGEYYVTFQIWHTKDKIWTYYYGKAEQRAKGLYFTDQYKMESPIPHSFHISTIKKSTKGYEMVIIGIEGNPAGDFGAFFRIPIMGSIKD